VQLAREGQEALDFLTHTGYELILMDCHMPGMDGFEATRKIRQLEDEQGRSPVPIVALTADVQIGIVEKCCIAGMNDYISKPFALARLRDILKKWITTKGDRPTEPTCVATKGSKGGA
jgi:CheY-like chemotaxis protein